MLPPLDVNKEKLLTFSAVAERFKVPKSTVWRWARYGSQGIVLASRKIGGRWYTSEEAIQRYCDEATQLVLGPQDAEVNRQVAGYSAHRTHGQMSKALHDADRELRFNGFSGDGRIIERSTVSRELLIDLHEYIEQWMPGARVDPDGGYAAVRGGIFAHAVEILEGKHGKSRSLAAAKAWVNSIDLRTYDVRQLKGVGPTYESDWKCLLADPEFAKLVHKPAVIPELQSGTSDK